MPKSATTRLAAKTDTGRTTTHQSNQDVNIEAVIKANEALASGTAALGQEMFEFASKRVSETLSHSESFAHCKDPGEAFELNYEFAQKATQHYLEEANRLFALTGALSRQYWAPLEERTRQALKDVEDG